MQPVIIKYVIFFSYLFQYVAPLLDARLSRPVVVPFRTKKRHFIPPAVNVKQKTQAEQEAQARAAGVVVRQEYMERAINIACTGEHINLIVCTFICTDQMCGSSTLLILRMYVIFSQRVFLILMFRLREMLVCPHCLKKV